MASYFQPRTNFTKLQKDIEKWNYDRRTQPHLHLKLTANEKGYFINFVETNELIMYGKGPKEINELFKKFRLGYYYGTSKRVI